VGSLAWKMDPHEKAQSIMNDDQIGKIQTERS